MIDLLKLEARELGTEFHGCKHLLLALLRNETSATAQILARHGVRFEDLQTEVRRICSQ